MKKTNLRLVCGWLFCVVFLTSVFSGCNSTDYSKAQSLLDNGSYEEAAAAFEKLGDYKDSAEKAKEAQEQLTEQKKAAEEQALEEKYQEAIECLNKGNYIEARKKLEELENYKDSAEKVFCTLQLDDTYTFNEIEWKVIDTLGDDFILIGDTEAMDIKYDDTRVSRWYENNDDSYLDDFSDTFRDSVVYAHKGKRDSALFGSNYYDDYQPGGHHKQDDGDKKVLVVNRTNYSAKEELVSQHYYFAKNDDSLSKCHIAMWVDRTSLE